jgi:hypothetical protein
MGCSESILGTSLAGHNRRTLTLTSSFSINMAEDKEYQDSIDDEEPEPVPVLYTTVRDPKKVYLDKVHDDVVLNKVAHISGMYP